MKRIEWILFLLIAFILSMGLLVACGDDDDDDDDDDVADDDDDDDDTTDDDDDATCDLTDLCQFIVDNCENSGGFADVADCENLWLSECADPDAYMPCVCTCLEAADTCDALGVSDGCEYTCYNDYC